MRMNSMKVSLFLRYLAIVLIPIFVLLLMGTVSVLINQRYAVRQIQDSNSRALAQISNSIDFIFEELNSLEVIFSTSSEFLVSLNRILLSRSLDFEQSKVLATIQNFVNVSAYARPYVESIYVYIQNRGDRVLTTTDGIVELSTFNDREWFDGFLQRPESDLFWTQTRVLKRLPSVEEGRPVISIFRRLFPLVGVRVPGVVVLNIHREYLESFVNQLKSSPDQKIVILDNAGAVVFGDLPAYVPRAGDGKQISAGLYDEEVGGARYVASRLVSPRYGWVYLSLTPFDRFYGVSRPLRAVNIALVCFSVLVGTLITLYASRRSFRHIEEVLDVVDAAEKGTRLPPVPAKTDKGFSHITYTILRTFLERQYLQVQLSERKYRQKTLELLALQSQMNPHFLFNTLEAINWKVIELTGSPNQINDMIGGLSRILAYVLKSPFELETLRDEIGHAEDYLKIQRIRYKHKFTVRWDCGPGLEDHRVIRFLLQPLLENAIYHGIREAEGHRLITITVRETGGRLRLAVADDGLGIEPERLREITAKLADGEEEFELTLKNIGLLNTNKRIRLAFGREYGLGVESSRGRGTTVTVEIPSRA
jgi:two-component system sensor histidine kinase YesM